MIKKSRGEMAYSNSLRMKQGAAAAAQGNESPPVLKLK
jgi:hypothetical protein